MTAGEGARKCRHICGPPRARTVVIRVDRPAHGAETVVAVGQDIGHGKLLESACARRLDNAHVRDVMEVRRQIAVSNDADPRSIMAVQYVKGHRAFPRLSLSTFFTDKGPGLPRTGDCSHRPGPAVPRLPAPVGLQKVCPRFTRVIIDSSFLISDRSFHPIRADENGR